MGDARNAAEPVDGDRSRWGRVRGTRTSTLWIAIPAGLVLAAAFGVVFGLSSVAGPQPVMAGIVFAVVTVWACFGLVWALIVDRRTLHGAVDRPEESVESRWFDASAGKAFTDVLLVVSIGGAVIAIGGLEPPVALVLPAVILVMAAAFGIRYLIARMRG